MMPKIYFTVQRRCAVGATSFNRAPILQAEKGLHGATSFNRQGRFFGITVQRRCALLVYQVGGLAFAVFGCDGRGLYSDAPAKLSPVELREYRRGRDSAVATLAAELNTKALVIEL